MGGWQRAAVAAQRTPLMSFKAGLQEASSVAAKQRGWRRLLKASSTHRLRGEARRRPLGPLGRRPRFGVAVSCTLDERMYRKPRAMKRRLRRFFPSLTQYADAGPHESLD